MRRHESDVKPFWHEETCADCSRSYEELSDPRASLHLCHECFVKRTGRSLLDAPLQRDLYKYDWWDKWCALYDAHKAQGDLDSWLRTKELL